MMSCFSFSYVLKFPSKKQPLEQFQAPKSIIVLLFSKRLESGHWLWQLFSRTCFSTSWRLLGVGSIGCLQHVCGRHGGTHPLPVSSHCGLLIFCDFPKDTPNKIHRIIACSPFPSRVTFSLFPVTKTRKNTLKANDNDLFSFLPTSIQINGCDV